MQLWPTNSYFRVHWSRMLPLLETFLYQLAIQLDQKVSALISAWIQTGLSDLSTSWPVHESTCQTRAEPVRNTCFARARQTHPYQGRVFPSKGRVFPYKNPCKMRVFGCFGIGPILMKTTSFWTIISWFGTVPIMFELCLPLSALMMLKVLAPRVGKGRI